MILWLTLCSVFNSRARCIGLSYGRWVQSVFSQPKYHTSVKLHTQSCLRRGEERPVLTCALTPSTDELPYFQCFFVDEDEAQFPFYAFSPLIWSFSLTAVWGIQCSQFLITTRSHHILCRWNTAAVHCWSAGQKSLDSREWWMMDHYFISWFGWALIPNTCSQCHSFPFCSDFFIIIICIQLFLHGTKGY